MVQIAVHVFVLLVIWTYTSTTVLAETKCETCRSIVTKFKEGIENTAKSNFGGGNTNWEERKLGTYAFSETRLLEILDHSCSDNKECHYMLEENEDVIEDWWFKHYAKTKKYNLLEYFCINSIKVCCQDGYFGKDCSSCPGDTKNPCTGNGVCQGSGTREGKGDCTCNAGYTGELCADCKDNYFQQEKNETHTICIACHRACNSTCRGENVEDCDDCKTGWTRGESGGCSDINECEENASSETKLCADSQLCVNNEGSYTCRACDRACASCTGEGPEHCVTCSSKYFMDNQVCKKCHKSCSLSCTDDTPMTCDECTSGWVKDEQLGCRDVDECVEGGATCNNDTYCENTDGYHLCKACHKSCNGCHGPAPTDCTVCQQGYRRDENNECADVDECVVDVDTVCSGLGEKCVNIIGSYKCECLAEYVFVRGKCQLKNKVKKKKKQTDAESKMPPPTVISSPEDGDKPKGFQEKLDESMEGFQKIMENLGREQAKPIDGKPLDDHLTMEGVFKDGLFKETPKSVDNKDMPKNSDSEINKKRTDFVKDDL